MKIEYFNNLDPNEQEKLVRKAISAYKDPLVQCLIGGLVGTFIAILIITITLNTETILEQSIQILGSKEMALEYMRIISCK